MCSGAFITKEYTYDAMMLKKYFLDQFDSFKNVTIKYSAKIKTIQRTEKYYIVSDKENNYSTNYLINATYASINQIINKVNLEMYNIKYEKISSSKKQKIKYISIHFVK